MVAPWADILHDLKDPGVKVSLGKYTVLVADGL